MDSAGRNLEDDDAATSAAREAAEAANEEPVQQCESGGAGVEGRGGTGHVGKRGRGVGGSRCLGDTHADEVLCGEASVECRARSSGRSEKEEEEGEEQAGEDPGERYDGELLVLAERLGRRLLPAFENPTGDGDGDAC